MQRKRGTNHADWYFFTYITKNRLGAGKYNGMYVREEDVFHAVYHQLKIYVNEHFISDSHHKQVIKRLLGMLFVIMRDLLTEKSSKRNFGQLKMQQTKRKQFGMILSQVRRLMKNNIRRFANY